MIRRARNLSMYLTLGVALTACDKEDTNNPEVGANLLGPSANAAPQDDDAMGGGEWSAEGDDDLGLGEDAEGGMGEEPTAQASDLPKLPPRAEPKKQCRGRGKKRKCTMRDPKPKVSAAYGVRTLMGNFRWGMSPMEVIKVLSQDIEDEYAERQKKASGAVDQDRNRNWRQEQIQALKANHVKFTSGSKHKWGVSLIQYEYEDDADEEMIWVKSNATLRKFYFFKNGELWKIVYAYSTDTWPGMSHEQVKEEKFKKWFGVSPEEKVKQDPKSGAPVLRYTEWTAMGNETIRAFDMTQVHGVIALAVVDGNAEKRIGERLPNAPKEEKFNNTVSDVLGETDVCYDSDGNIQECDITKGVD